MLLITSGVMSVFGQESLRMSLAGAEAVEARRKAAVTQGYYNLQLGPTAWKFGSALSIQVNDNIQLESVRPRSDLILSPELDTRMAWPVSRMNSLNLALGIGYQAYLWHPEFSRFFVSPGTELSFDLYAGDFWFSIHDRFSVSQNNYQDPTLVGSADYSRLENAVGLAVVWDLNKILFKAGYDHINYVSLTGTTSGLASQPDGASEVFFGSAGYAPQAGLLTGMELGAAFIRYTSTGTNQGFEATQWNAGPFADVQLSQYMHARASTGYTVFSPNTSGGSVPATELSGLYAQVELKHQVNQYLDYILGGGRNITFDFYGGTVDVYLAQLRANWKLVRKLNLATTFEYQHGTQLSFYAETFDRYGPGLSLGRAITAKLNANISYQYYWRGSDQPDRNYALNLITSRLEYRF